jgi:NAD(P)-dependent dehydrogenase (short-subunit alcohol dehydrogenase family)
LFSTSPTRRLTSQHIALAADHSPEGIRVNAVGPGPIFTPFHQRRIAAAGETVEQYNAKSRTRHHAEAPG